MGRRTIKTGLRETGIVPLSKPYNNGANRDSIESRELVIESGLNFSGNARELSPLTFLTAGKQFPLKLMAKRECRVPNSSHRIPRV